MTVLTRLPMNYWLKARNDTKLSRAVHHDVKLIYHHFNSHEKNQSWFQFLHFLVNGWKIGYFVDWSALSNHHALETMLWSAVQRIQSKPCRRLGTKTTEQLGQMCHIGLSANHTLSRTDGCYDPPMPLLTVHMHFDTVFKKRWGRAK